MGAWGERVAAEYLRCKGFSLLAHSYRSRFGEIDLIVSDDRFLVFVEVKLRKNDKFARAVEYVDYKKQEREKEVEVLSAKIEQKQTEYDVLSKRIENYDEGLESLTALEQELNAGDKYILPEPQGFMTAKAYKNKIAEPLVEKLKSMLKSALVKAFEGWDNYYRLNIKNGSLYQENQELSRVNKKLTEENTRLRAENKDYSLLRKVFGRKAIEDLVEQAKAKKGSERRNERSR